MNDAVVMKVGKAIYHSDHLVGVELSVLVGAKNVDTHDGNAGRPRVLLEILQETSIWHPRGHCAQLGDVGSHTENRDQVGVIQPLPHRDFRIVPLV